MKTTIKAAAVATFALILTACGGGGGDSTSSQASMSANTSGSTNQASVPTSIALSGMVYASQVQGTTVTAYAVQPDGSNGTVLGTAAITGVDGKFSMTLSSTPSGMVRFAASGGTFISEADRTTQPIDTLELVTPSVSSSLNNFVITPATHMASRAFAYQASKAGATLSNAYSIAMNTVFSLLDTNVALRGDANAVVHILSTVPNSSADTGHAYQDLLTGFEWFGVKYDLPSKVVFRIGAANAEAGFPANGVNGANAAINVGTWVNNAFDETQALTMDQMLQMPIADPSAPVLHYNMKSLLSVNIIRDVYLDAACKDATQRPDLLVRYPSLAGFFGSVAESGGCTGAADRIAALKANVTTNHRSLMQ